MKQGQIPKRARYSRLLQEYEKYLREREEVGEIKKVTRETYLRDARAVMAALVAALPTKDIKAKVRLLYRGDYGAVIKELKAIMEERRP